jgi:hypothetical protein
MLGEPGALHPIDLDLTLIVRVPSRVAGATGTLAAPDWVGVVQVEGTIEWCRWGLCYDLRFDKHWLEGRLAFDPRCPVSSATRVVGIIGLARGRIARVELRWDLRHEAMTLLRSWRRELDPGILRPGGSPR